ncbi:MAG TPA: glycosyltransferase [Acidimicrobiales bacterium]
MSAPAGTERSGAQQSGTEPATASDEEPLAGNCTVVIATRNRAEELVVCLRRLNALPSVPPIVVVDNASSDGSPEAVVTGFPDVELVRLAENLGASARNVGVARSTTPYVALCDDDATWRPGSLERGVELLGSLPDVALVAPVVRVWGEAPDPVSLAMASSPLGRHRASGLPRVLGFLACAAMVRRSAFLAVGGFAPWLGIGGEEELLAMDLARAGWDMLYEPAMCADHYPSTHRDQRGRERLLARNALWVAWSRRRPLGAVRSTARTAAAARTPAARAGLLDAVRGVSVAALHRRPVPPVVESRLCLLERGSRGRAAGRRTGPSLPGTPGS